MSAYGGGGCWCWAVGEEEAWVVQEGEGRVWDEGGWGEVVLFDVDHAWGGLVRKMYVFPGSEDGSRGMVRVQDTMETVLICFAARVWLMLRYEIWREGFEIDPPVSYK